VKLFQILKCLNLGKNQIKKFRKKKGRKTRNQKNPDKTIEPVKKPKKKPNKKCEDPVVSIVKSANMT
jgi:hypothetical protein